MSHVLAPPVTRFCFERGAARDTDRCEELCWREAAGWGDVNMESAALIGRAKLAPWRELLFRCCAGGERRTVPFDLPNQTDTGRDHPDPLGLLRYQLLAIRGKSRPFSKS